MDDLVFGLQVTILGMGIVFGLLALLWLLLTLVLRLERRAESRAVVRTEARAEAWAEPQPGATADGFVDAPAGDGEVVQAAGSEPASPVLPGSVRLVGAPADLDPGLVAAIGVVILRHTETRRRQAAPAMRSYWPGSLLFASRWVASGRTRQARSWTRRAR